MAKYQQYAEYKDSGIEWLGEIPRDWNTIQVGRLYTRNKRTGFVDKELLSVYRDYGVIPKSSRDDNNNKPSDDLSPYQLVKPDDLVMNKMKAWQGSIAISEYEGIVSPAYFVYEPNSKLFDLAFPRYVHYLLRNPIYITQYLSRSKGIRVNQWDLDPDEFRKIELLLPSKDEQSKISEFLDFETAQIDTLIEKQQTLIQLLKEKRQAVISHAVTKGLNPDAPMKDSGVEWLGEVPEHWTIIQLKHACDLLKDGTHLPPPRVDVGIPLLSVRNVVNGKFIFRDDDSQISERDYNQLSKSFTPQTGDVLLAIVGGTLGKAAVVENMNNFHIQRSLAIFRTNQLKINNYFLNFLFNSQGFQSLLWENAGFSAQPGIYLGTLSNFLIPMPSLSEQIEITNFLNGKVYAFDNLINKAEQAIQLMQERRTALISAAVTGKIDVRSWIVPE